MDLNDVETKLKFNDVYIQCRSVLKLKEAVIAKSPKGHKISSSSQKIPELTILWENCGDECFTTGNLVTETLVSLVTEGYMDLDYAIGMFISYIVSLRYLQAPVHGLYKLLCFHVKSSVDGSGNYKSHYSLLNPKHPFIMVLQTRPDSWNLVMQKIVEVFRDKVEFGFELMEPVLHFIFSNPMPSNDICQLKSLLCEKLCRIVSRNHSEKLLNFLCRSVLWLQVTNFSGIARASDFVDNIKETVTNVQNLKNSSNQEELLYLSLALSHCCLEHGFDALELLQMAEDLSCKIPESNRTSTTINSCFILWTMLLGRSSCDVLKKLLSIGMTLLQKRTISPIVAAMAIQPVIQNLSCPKLISFDSKEHNHLLLMECQTHLEGYFNVEVVLHEKESMLVMQNFSAFTILSNESEHCLTLSFKLDSFDSKVAWLNFVKEKVNSGGTISDFIFHLVLSLFVISSGSKEFLQPCFETIKAIAKSHTEMSTRLFPLLMYKLMKVWEPESRWMILQYLPETATHKYAISQVLNTLQLLFNHPDMKAQVICLMLKLWKIHDRCLPFLSRLLNEKNTTISSTTGVPEVLISQVAAVKDICSKMPHQHGGQFLGFLSTVLNESNDFASIPAACLALEGVYILCQNEVIDIRSTWKILSPKLCKDKRILILKKMFKLLSLIPSLRVQSFEYDKFMNEIAAYLWRQISSETNPVIVGCAYQALAGFPPDSYVLKQLPAAAKENLKLPASMASTPFEMGKPPEDVLSYIPGYCFIDLLKCIKDKDILEGYSKFLECFVDQEVKELPRATYSQRQIYYSKRLSNNALDQVPGFLCSQCHENRIPTIQRNLALGVLLSYEPPMDIGKDGKPQKHSLAAQTRYYEQVLEILVNEVNLDTSEWRRCVLITSAWSTFMEHAFLACEEGRRIELDLQCRHGQLDKTKDEVEILMDTSWLWVRDRFLEIIKNASRNKSSSLGNAIFAVGGLTKALDKFYRGMDDSLKKLSVEHLKTLDHDTYRLRCMNTFIKAMNPSYTLSPDAKVFSWMLTHLSNPSSTVGYLIQGCAASSIANLTTILTSEFSDEVSHLLQLLLQNVLSSTSSVLQLYSGIGLGLLVKALCQGGYYENNENNARNIGKMVETLSSSCVADDEAKVGEIVGLTIILSSLSQNENQTFVETIKKNCNYFYDKLMTVNRLSIDFQVISVCVCSMVISGAFAGIIEDQRVLDMVNWLNEKRKCTPQCDGISISLGILVDGLQKLGNSLGSDLRQELFRNWTEILLGEKQPTLHRLSALNGLCALFSSGAGLVLLNSDLVVGDLTSGLNDLVQFMYKLLRAPRDSGLQNICAWQLGLIFSVHSGQKQMSASVPTTYNMLNETSVLKPLVSFVSEYCKSGGDESFRPQLLVALNILSKDFTRPLPPLNWIAFLKPLLQRSHDKDVMEKCLKIAINQISGSSNAVTLLTAYIIPPVLYTIPVNSRLLLFKHTAQLVAFLPPSKLQLFFKSIFREALEDKENFEEGLVALQAIVDTLKLPHSSKPGVAILEQTLLSVAVDLKNKLPKLKKCLPLICKGLSLLSEVSVNSIITISDDTDDLEPLIMLWCQLVKDGIAPLKSLRKCIETLQHATESDKGWFISNFFQIFLPSTCNTKNDMKQPDKCILFLMETIGQAKIFASSHSQDEVKSKREMLFLIDICLAMIVGSAGFEVTYALWPEWDVTHPLLLSSLPSALYYLLSKEKWNEVADKIFEWLLFLLKSCYLEEDEKTYVKNSFILARSLKEFCNAPVWMKIFY